MGEADRYLEYPRSKRRITLGADNNALMALLALNIIFFLLLLTIKVICYYFESDKSSFITDVLQYFAMPASLTILLQRPWTLLTQMFTHTDPLLILSNMLWLWAFGNILQQLTGNKKLIPVYIYGGLAGAVFFIAANYLIPSLRTFNNLFYLMGANAATISVAVATTTLAPDFRFFRHLRGGIPIWVLTAIYLLIDVVGITAGFGKAEGISHLGGALAGLLFALLLKKGKDTGEWMNELYDWFMNLFNPVKKRRNRGPGEKLFYNSGGRKPYTKYPSVTQKRIDEILDKINQQGFNFLSDEEKNILKKASEEDL